MEATGKSLRSWCASNRHQAGRRVMSDRLSTKSVCGTLRQYLRSRPDLGLGEAMRDAVFEPVNPFDSKATRAPRRWFVLFSVITVMAFSFFLYFNNLL